MFHFSLGLMTRSGFESRETWNNINKNKKENISYIALYTWLLVMEITKRLCQTNVVSFLQVYKPKRQVLQMLFSTVGSGFLPVWVWFESKHLWRFNKSKSKRYATLKGASTRCVATKVCCAFSHFWELVQLHTWNLALHTASVSLEPLLGNLGDIKCLRPWPHGASKIADIVLKVNEFVPASWSWHSPGTKWSQFMTKTRWSDVSVWFDFHE